MNAAGLAMHAELPRTQSRPRHSRPACHAAYDEVFARLDRPSIEPKSFRHLAHDLDRQHARLQRLLRELDEPAPSS